jgi:hypothetical protein
MVFKWAQVEFSGEVRPICLPKRSSLAADEYDSDSVTLTGWGNMFKNGPPSPTLMKGSLQIFDYE